MQRGSIGVTRLPSGELVLGKHWMLLIGINNYLHWTTLRGPVRDCNSLEEVLLECYTFEPSRTIKLFNEQATRAGILTTFRKLKESMQPEDSLLIFYAGHGKETELGAGYWICHDAEKEADKGVGWLTHYEVGRALASIECAHLLLLMDSCYSDDIFQGERGIEEGSFDHEYFRRAYEYPSREVMVSGLYEPVIDRSEFAACLVDTLRRNHDGCISPIRLFAHVQRGVSGQLPYLGILPNAGHQRGGSFLFFLRPESRAKSLVQEAKQRLEADDLAGTVSLLGEAEQLRPLSEDAETLLQEAWSMILNESWMKRYRMLESKDTVLVVVGTRYKAEIDDRPIASFIQAELTRSGQMAFTITDAEYLKQKERFADNPVISVGGPRTNKVTKELDGILGIDESLYIRTDQKVAKVDASPPAKAVIWGFSAKDTMLVLREFIREHLSYFLKPDVRANKVILAPHPNDAFFCLGGCLTQWRKEGTIKVFDVFCTIGHSSFISSRDAEQVGVISSFRKIEELANAASADVRVVFLGFPSAGLRRRYKTITVSSGEDKIDWDIYRPLINEVKKLIPLDSATQYYFPLGLFDYVDHLVVRNVGIELMRERKIEKVYFYEDIMPLTPVIEGEVVNSDIQDDPRYITEMMSNLDIPVRAHRMEIDIREALGMAAVYFSEPANLKKILPRMERYFRSSKDGKHYVRCWSAQRTPEKIVGKDGAEMVSIPSGEFQMGTEPEEIPKLLEWAKKWSSNLKKDWFERETPRHTVYLDAFYIDKYQVTNELFKKFVDETGYVTEAEKRGYSWIWKGKVEGVNWKHPQNPEDDISDRMNHPVVHVSWNDADAYAKWAGKRLPTEAEWEKAARGGLVGKKFPWGDEDPDGTQCNFADKNTDFSWSDKSVDDGYKYTAPVGSYSPNGYGLYDMTGNVWEWCADWYDENYYSKSPSRNPTGPNSGKYRVCRGGSWHGDPDGVRVAGRGRDDPSKGARGVFVVVFRPPVSSIRNELMN